MKSRRSLFALTIPESCPEGIKRRHLHSTGQYLFSDYPYLAEFRVSDKRKISKKKVSRSSGSDSTLFPMFPNAEPPTIESGPGSMGLPPDEDPFGKRHYGLPVDSSGSISAMLLPMLKLPANWRDFLPEIELPDSLSGLLLWGSPDEDAGMTLNLFFQGRRQQVQISPAEMANFSHHLTDIRQLLYWLAPKLNGREWFIDVLLQQISTMTEAATRLMKKSGSALKSNSLLYWNCRIKISVLSSSFTSWGALLQAQQILPTPFLPLITARKKRTVQSNRQGMRHPVREVQMQVRRATILINQIRNVISRKVLPHRRHLHKVTKPVAPRLQSRCTSFRWTIPYIACRKVRC